MVTRAIGANALANNISGSGNTACGGGALSNFIQGLLNTAIGESALSNSVHGHDNIAIGFDSASNVTTASNVICIGSSVAGANVDNGCYIGNIAGQTVDPNGAGQVYIDNSGKLGVFLSSQRFKRDIERMGRASEAILSLNPVAFHYKSDAKNTPCYGLIAEEVAKVNPGLVLSDKEGKPYTVRYDQVNAMLLNEFLKEHCKVQELESTVAKQEASAAKQQAAIAVQQKQIEALTAGLQKVSAQLELNKPTPQTVLNNQ
jgi:trimeric autotransporter adhesin